MKNLLLLIIIFICFGCISRKTLKSPENPLHDYLQAINMALKYHIENGYWAEIPFKVKQTISIDTLSCNYLKSNFQYYLYFIDQQNFEKPKNLNFNNIYDYKGIQKLLNNVWKLPFDASLYSVPLEIISEDNIVNETKIWPTGTFSFSPLIPMKKKDIFEIWLTIERDRDPPFYAFRINKVNGKFIVTGHSWGDWCDLVTDKDYIKELE